MIPIAAEFTGTAAGASEDTECIAPDLSEDLRCGVRWLAVGLVISSFLWGAVLAGLWALLLD